VRPEQVKPAKEGNPWVLRLGGGAFTPKMGEMTA